MRLNCGRNVDQEKIQDKFCRLFNLSLQKDSLICDAGRWEAGKWQWFFECRRPLLAREE